MLPYLRLGSIVAVLAIALGAAIGIAACRREAAPRATAGRPGFGGDFTLTNQDGQPFHLADLRGKAVLLFFGYTFCPDMCPMTLAHVMDVMKRLGEAGQDVVPVFVSLDPQRDTPAIIKTYVRHFSPTMIGLTGTPKELAAVAAKYHVTYTTLDTGTNDYLINHTTAIFLINRHGVLHDYVANDEPTDRLAAAVLAMLRDYPAADRESR
jgi:protein SCO1